MKSVQTVFDNVAKIEAREESDQDLTHGSKVENKSIALR